MFSILTSLKKLFLSLKTLFSNLLGYNFVESLFVKQKSNLPILYKNDNYIVIDKPYDVRINSNDPNIKGSVHEMLCREFPDLGSSILKHYFYFIHRLDYATSGVLCVALNRKACSEASKAFEKRLTSKYYLAILRGFVSVDEMVISKPIGEIPGDECHRMCVNGANPREAITSLVVLERGVFNSYPATRVLLKPLTGRRHQLRVHTSYIGHTIVGDFTYSGRKDTSPTRTYLHAYRLILPTGCETLDISTAEGFKFTIDSWIPFSKICDLSGETFFKIDNLTASVAVEVN